MTGNITAADFDNISSTAQTESSDGYFPDFLWAEAFQGHKPTGRSFKHIYGQCAYLDTGNDLPYLSLEMFACTLHSLWLLPCSCWPATSWCLFVSVQGYDNTESSVRKASVFCLVAIYSVIGEELKPHLAQLTGSKVPTTTECFCTNSHTCLSELLQQTLTLIIFSGHVWAWPACCPIIRLLVILVLLSPHVCPWL